ncbi:MAG: hypothetical protein JNJ59_06280 [Deltaproteobacteria bacterium]|jgi:hypothetical protein|nr:hypothetical protein [Deltaproteobacteria bacterium]
MFQKLRTPLARLAALVVVAQALGFTACSDECDTLIEETCARVGEDKDSCKRLRQKVQNPSPEDKRLCGQALKLTQRLVPSK